MAKNIEEEGRETEDGQETGCECKGVRVRGGVDKEGNLVVDQAPLDPKVVHEIHLEAMAALQQKEVAEGGPVETLPGGGSGKTRAFRVWL